MPRIENVAAADIPTGFHAVKSENCMLIQIADPCGWFPTPSHSFKEAHHFEFLDVEHEFENAAEVGIQQDQAKTIVELLKRALADNMDVVVHCTAGICRSGAVVEVGVMMGFDECPHYRCPNLLVKHSLMRELGWTYDSNEKPYVRFPADDADVEFMNVRSNYGVVN